MLDHIPYVYSKCTFFVQKNSLIKPTKPPQLVHDVRTTSSRRRYNVHATSFKRHVPAEFTRVRMYVEEIYFQRSMEVVAPTRILEKWKKSFCFFEKSSSLLYNTSINLLPCLTAGKLARKKYYICVFYYSALFFFSFFFCCLKDTRSRLRRNFYVVFYIIWSTPGILTIKFLLFSELLAFTWMKKENFHENGIQ